MESMLNNKEFDLWADGNRNTKRSNTGSWGWNRNNNEWKGENIMNRVEIRYIEQKDDPAIAKIIRENLRKYHLDIPGTAYYDPELDHLSKYYLENVHERVYFIAETEAGEVVGGIGMELFAGFDRCGEIQKLYVSEKMKRQGIGQRLLETVENYAGSRGIERLYLETHSNLREAVALYEKNGYQKINRPKEVVHSTMDLFYIKEFVSDSLTAKVRS